MVLLLCWAVRSRCKPLAQLEAGFGMSSYFHAICQPLLRLVAAVSSREAALLKTAALAQVWQSNVLDLAAMVD